MGKLEQNIDESKKIAEDTWRQNVSIVAAVAGGLSIVWQIDILSNNTYLVWSIAASALITSGMIMDSFSTERAFAKGSNNIIETNPYLPSQPTANDLYGARNISRNIAGVISGIVIAPIGIVLGISHWMAAINNLKIANRLE